MHVFYIKDFYFFYTGNSYPPPDILGIDDYEAFKTSLMVHRSQ
jgi:hypothetical protein